MDDRKPGKEARTLAVLLVALVAGCQDGAVAHDAGVLVDAGGTTECGPTLSPRGRACVPMLDRCTGNQIPVPGGGFKRVGVEACDGGLRAPPDWTCKRVGPPTTCLQGWAMTTEGWCEPILPARPCPEGKMEVIGKGDCQPIMSCGSGAWGNIALTPDTVHVDQSHNGADADGSKAKPFATIEAAVAAAPMDREAHIAVAAGVYKYSESLTVQDRALVLEGRCPEKVRLLAADQAAAVTSKNSELTLRGVSVQSKGAGLLVVGGNVVVDRVHIAGCHGRDGGAGLDVDSGNTPAKVLVKDSLVEETRGHGVYLKSGTLAIERSVVRRIQPPAAGVVSIGGTLALQDSLVDDNQAGGVLAEFCIVTVNRTVVRRIKKKSGVLGYAIDAPLVIKDSLVADAATGINLAGATATVLRTVVRDSSNAGILLQKSFAGTGPSDLVLRESALARNGLLVKQESTATVERTLVRECPESTAGVQGDVGTKTKLADCILVDNHKIGIVTKGAKLTLERSLVQDTLPRANGIFGAGVVAMTNLGGDTSVPSTVALTDSTITGSHHVALALLGSEAMLTRSVVRDTHEPVPRRWGAPGVLVAPLLGVPSTLEIEDSLVASNADFGVYIEGSKASLVRTAVRDTSTRLGDKSGGFGIYVTRGEDKLPTTLEMSDCQVSVSRAGGLYVAGAKAEVERCQVLDTQGDIAGYGDGIALEGASAWLTLKDSLVEKSERAGLLVRDGGGFVDRCVFARGVVPIALSGATPLEVGSNNEFLDNVDNRVSYPEELPAPPPPVLPPPPVFPEP